MDRLTAMKVFAEVAARKSFTAAADNLDMSRAMTTRYVNELESWLGARLLNRSTRRISLTEAGEACLLRCRQILDITDDVEAVAGKRETEPYGLIRITTSVAFGQVHLAPVVAEYLKRYPKTRVDMQLLDRSVNLIEERIDLAIRTTNDLDPNLIARKLTDCRSVICASPQYLKERGAPRTPRELTEHNCLTYSHFGKSQWRFTHKKTGAVDAAEVTGNLSANEVLALTNACTAGAGIAMLPTYMVTDYVKRGELTALLTDWEALRLGMFGVYQSRKHMPATLRTLLDFLVERFGDTPPWDDDILG
ncbi:LysR family transcriptional regulator [Hahella aquimaris]|uniref:LysR family transcriptional regulator n=1 Tax=Hahella sp. HNIBRBA332 TaxID=3015983 RepID=UPI00273CCA71|nr:LysR family transcriptional regulator [Hahella sp. HNIBRBA332]WLQ12017.1 LysR family transcriptional regulator [Hahella sp. HNIBRBA332]